MPKNKAVTEFIMPAQYARAKGLTKQRISAMIKAKHPAIEIRVKYGRKEIRDAQKSDVAEITK